MLSIVIFSGISILHFTVIIFPAFTVISLLFDLSCEILISLNAFAISDFHVLYVATFVKSL